MFNEEHSSCDSCWTVGVGAVKHSKIASDLMKGRGPNRPKIEVSMMGFVEDPEPLLARQENGRVILDTRIASQADIDGGVLPVRGGLWVIVRQRKCSVIFVGCLVGDESSIATDFLSSSDKHFSRYRLGLSIKFHLGTPPLLPLLGPNNPPNLSPSPGPIRMMHSKSAAPACGISKQQLLTFDKNEKQ